MDGKGIYNIATKIYFGCNAHCIKNLDVGTKTGMQNMKILKMLCNFYLLMYPIYRCIPCVSKRLWHNEQINSSSSSERNDSTPSNTISVFGLYIFFSNFIITKGIQNKHKRESYKKNKQKKNRELLGYWFGYGM